MYGNSGCKNVAQRFDRRNVLKQYKERQSLYLFQTKFLIHRHIDFQFNHTNLVNVDERNFFYK